MIPGKTRVAGIAMAKDPVVCCTWSSLQTVDGTPGPTYSSGPCLQSCAAANQSLVTTDTSIDVARAVHVARTELLSTARVWVSWLPVLITRTHPLHLPTLLTETHLLRQQGAQLIVVAVGPLAGDVTRRLMDAGCNVITVNHSSLLSDMTAALLNLLCTDRFAAHSPDYKHDPLLLRKRAQRQG
ncbi:hypothetical protein C0Q70_15872 [Pomacea canaliculata]|uniref:Uncharacterized protein n=1 Tax=Pomacea canaliculata TaxID=400727 RepID=A0A2T7NW40_POMCA|nr:hypothetical protein C0Q70_15872 [Pomacea canaliculata]